MNYFEFIDVFGNNPVIDIRNVENYFGKLDRRRLYEWQQRGLIIRLANNFYIPAKKHIDSNALKSIACKIYEPSYIGLQSALAWHNLIPEAVFQTTAVTTRRNKRFATPVGSFHYRSIKREYFFGIALIDTGQTQFHISDPEKTLLDYFHFVRGSDQRDTIEEMRLNFEEINSTINWPRMDRYLRIISSPKLNRAAHHVKEMTRAEYR